LVNGTIVVDNGNHTGARPGKVIYGPGKTGATPKGKANGGVSCFRPLASAKAIEIVLAAALDWGLCVAACVVASRAG